MAGLFDFLDFKSKNWEEVQVREFSASECDAITSCKVIAGDYGKRVCFTVVVKGETKTAYMSLEPVANVAVGDNLDPHNLSMVFLKYIGNNPGQKKLTDIKIRVNTPIQKEEASFDNPFGL